MRRLLILVLALGALAIGVPMWMWRGPGPLPKPTIVQIPEGATIASAAKALEEAHAIRSATWFRGLAGKLGSRDPIRAGEFRIPAHASAATILDTLQHGRPALKLVTIPEGTPSVIVQDKLMATKALTGSVPVPPEGSVLPDSYAYQAGDSRLMIVQRMQKAMDKALAAEWTARAPNLVVTTPRQALILASIVEKETGVASEQAMVAGVYSNRLKLGMALQADPTVIYPVTKGRPLGRRILESELHAKNGYNTYAEPGLPEGPICNPGRASINAVLHPAVTQALYFVANGQGGHVFADTLAQHNANVKKWYAIRHARGEM
ncbi:endolytic transglycosylase MltG [Sphingomonas oryzagri]|uniref:Endolytic murein transglycosylase n=1 Tax=Sphingomonas oryzagri TaxID=3042314 RepID=A0ABT6MXN3_9SPHN|nr:endolytic transglycosylase MltG [Sphingomonas oryzagri]MDH7637814.1 endolytic transglycosylase MltG [Sphingomonas oryzagri]